MSREETTGNQFEADLVQKPVPAELSTALMFRKSPPTIFEPIEGMTQTTLLGGPLKEKVNAKTSMAVRASVPFQPRGIIHVLEIDIQANVWLIGSQLEKTMAQEIEKKRPDIRKLT